MVVKMMRWPAWPPVLSSSSSSSTSRRNYEVKMVVKKVEGLIFFYNNDDDGDKKKIRRSLKVEVKWKGEKSRSSTNNSIGFMGPLKRRSISVKNKKMKSSTGEGRFCGDGVFEWNQEFTSLCNFSAYKDTLFYPWEVVFTVFTCLNQEPRNTVLVGTATINLAEFVSKANENELEINVPLTVPRKTTDDNPSIRFSLRLIELGTFQEPPQAIIQPVLLSPSSEEAQLPRKNELYGLKASLRKVRIFRGTKKACHDDYSSDGKVSVRGEDGKYNYPFDTDSLDDDVADSESEDCNIDSSSQLSFNYKTIAYSNIAGGSHYSSPAPDAGDEAWIFHKPDMVSLRVGKSAGAVCEESLRLSSKRRILSWKKRTLRFRSAKPKVKGEPLLKKDHGESGGDDIDFDRRQLSTSDESSLWWSKSEDGSTSSRSSFSEFGDDHFAVGKWELKELISRDGRMKLQAQVFLASIDQRSERAAGESACTVLVAVIANWLQSNPYELPIKSEFDSLIRDGSFEWRNLCENEDYRQQFPDKHFDLETIIQAKIRPLSVIPEKSFIGFFHPEGLEGKDFDFLQGSMSFDSIWEEITNNCEDPVVYIVSWNDHFFILKVEQDAYYIIDTLGERLYEGCNQAYVLKFDKDTTIHQLPAEKKLESASDKLQPSNSKENINISALQSKEKNEMEEQIVCKGKESCKDYIKSFLAEIPIRDLQVDIKKGLIASTLLHHRLQIDFHYTSLTNSTVQYSSKGDLSSTVVAET